MVDRMMFPLPFQRWIATKRVDVLEGPFPGFGLAIPHEFLGTPRLDDLGGHTGFPLQEPKDDAFARRRRSPRPTRSHLLIGRLPNPTALLTFADSPVRPDPQALAQPIGGLELEPLKDAQLSAQPTQPLALSTQLAFHQAATRVHNLAGATEKPLATSQPISRITKTGVSSRTQAPLLAHPGEETP
jgi:hypothetical protein